MWNLNRWGLQLSSGQASAVCCGSASLRYCYFQCRSQERLSSETTRVPVRRANGCLEWQLNLGVRCWRRATEPSTPPSQLSPKLEQTTISSRRSSLRRREKEDRAQKRRDETDLSHQFQNAKDTLSAMIVEKRRRSSERKASRVLRKGATVRVNAPKCAEKRRRRIETRDFGVSGASSELVMLANNTQN